MNWLLAILAVVIIVGISIAIANKKQKRLPAPPKPGPLESAFIEMENGWEMMTDEEREKAKKGATKLFKGYAQTGTLRGAIQKFAEDEKPHEEQSKPKDPDLWI